MTSRSDFAPCVVYGSEHTRLGAFRAEERHLYELCALPPAKQDQGRLRVLYRSLRKIPSPRQRAARSTKRILNLQVTKPLPTLQIFAVENAAAAFDRRGHNECVIPRARRCARATSALSFFIAPPILCDTPAGCTRKPAKPTAAPSAAAWAGCRDAFAPNRTSIA